MSYVSLNYSNTLQCETITYLPMIWYFYFVAKPSKYSTIIKGLLLGIIISFKYTLGIVFVAEFFMIDEFYKSKSKFIISKSLEILIALGLLFITFLPTILQGNIVYIDGLFLYLDKYKNHPKINLSFVKDFIKGLGYLFGDSYSLLFSSSAIFSVVLIKGKSKTNKNYFSYALLFFMLLLFSFIIERKPNIYQFSRIYPFLILLSSIGIYYLFRSIKGKNLIVICFIFIFSIFLSPLPRVINTMRIPYDYIFNPSKYLYNFSNEGGTGNFQSLYNLKQYTDKKGSNFIFVNSGSHQFQRMTGTYYKYPLSAFYLGEYPHKSIINEVTNDMKKLDYLIIQNDDNHFGNFFNYKSSLENFNRIKEFKSLLNERFELDTIIDGRYYIYKNDKLINEN